MRVKIVHKGGPAFHFATKNGTLHLSKGAGMVADLTKRELDLLKTLAQLNAVNLEVIAVREQDSPTSSAVSKLSAAAETKNKDGGEDQKVNEEKKEEERKAKKSSGKKTK